jgi:hypothetical protein
LRFFERGIVFPLYPNGSYRGQWKKDGRPGSHDDMNDLSINLIPHLGSSPVRKTAVEADGRNACLVITDQAGNPLGPFCFAGDDEDSLSSFKHEANSLLQQFQPISPRSLYQNPSGSLAVYRLEQWLRPRHGGVRNARRGEADIAPIHLSR